MNIQVRRLNVARDQGLFRALCLLSALELGLLPGLTVWGQSDGSTPEANPQFQNSVQTPRANSGGPVDSISAIKAHAASASKNLDQAISPSSNNSPQQGIQIGASTAPVLRKKKVLSPLETRISIRVKNAPLATFLDAISAQAKINFLITEGLEAVKITAFLQHVTVREALQILLEIKGLTYRQIGKSNTYVIRRKSKNAPSFTTRIYSLSYIPLVNISQQGTQGQQGGAGGGQGGMLGGMGGSSSGGAQGGGGGGSPQGGGLTPGQGGQAIGMSAQSAGGGAGGGAQGMGGMPGAGAGGGELHCHGCPIGFNQGRASGGGPENQFLNRHRCSRSFSASGSADCRSGQESSASDD